MRRLIPAFAIALLTFTPADAASVWIVALGASNTYGMGRGAHMGGVQPARAWPAQLQALLRARGVNATVRNAGIPGDTTGRMLARLNAAVPNGTNLVILEPGGNDARRGQGGQTAGNVGAITSQLAARGIKVITVERTRLIAPPSSRDPDGQHFGAEGHAAVAAYLLPQVMSAVGGR
jgi:acyl-CoA thioesterase-1